MSELWVWHIWEWYPPQKFAVQCIGSVWAIKGGRAFMGGIHMLTIAHVTSLVVKVSTDPNVLQKVLQLAVFSKPRRLLRRWS